MNLQIERPYIEAAAPEHPSLLDPTHQMDSLFGVVNIPNVIWIDEDGVIVRPAEPGWPGVSQLPESFMKRFAERAKQEAEAPRGYVRQLALYRALLGKLYPQRPVRAALLWTESTEFIEISAPALDAELATLIQRDDRA